MPPSGFPYKKVLVVGATSGIGEALADRMIENGVSVVAVGRRKEKLDAFVQNHGGSQPKAGKGAAFAEQFDITDLEGVKGFVEKVTKSHPDLSALFLNSGIQRGFNFARPSSVDLSLVSAEFTTNYLSYLYLTNAFLPFLQAKTEPTALVYTTSGLALIPLLRCPNYCATKAALHHYILCLREQLRQEGSGVKVVEVLPPAVQTELHDEKHQPDIKNGRAMGMPLDEFTDQTWAALAEGKEQIPIGFAQMAYEAFENTRQERMYGMWRQVAGAK